MEDPTKQRDTKGCTPGPRLSAAEARTRDGPSSPPRLRLACQAGTADLEKRLQTTKPERGILQKKRRATQAAAASARWPHSKIKSCCIWLVNKPLKARTTGPSRRSGVLRGHLVLGACLRHDMLLSQLIIDGG